MARKRRRTPYKRTPEQSVPKKAHRILRLTCILMVLIVVRLWHLTVIQYEERLERSRKPQIRTVIERAERGVICDRFGIPLAINRVQYNAAILYSEISFKRHKRREYIEELSVLLADVLELDADRIEDLIYAKAALFHQVPYVIKKDITESQYYRLKMLEADWQGVYAERAAKRVYPYGKVAADVIGYMGAISREEYGEVLDEMHQLQEYLDLQKSVEDFDLQIEASHRLKELQEKAYALDDFVGKSGVEAQFEEQLRGYYGKRRFYSDARGNYLRELPEARAPVAGERLQLSISIELQEYAEQLLIQNERVRDGQRTSLPQPWIKGGAILAMDPHNGEVLAMASYPRFDPNDFIPTGNEEINRKKRSRVLQWLEHDAYIGQIWDGVRPLEREAYVGGDRPLVEEGVELTWKRYLDFILPGDHAVKEALRRVSTVGNAVRLLEEVERLVEETGVDTGVDSVSELIHSLPEFLSALTVEYDQLLLLDLCRLVVGTKEYSKGLLELIGEHSLQQHRTMSMASVTVSGVVRQMVQEIFHDIDFKRWRKNYGKSYLQMKRIEEKLERRYQRPYLDYFDALESRLFDRFWQKYRWELITLFLTRETGFPALHTARLRPYVDHLLSWAEEILQGAHRALPWHDKYSQLAQGVSEMGPAMVVEYLKSMRSYKDFNEPLWGHYVGVRSTEGKQLEKGLAAAFYPPYGFGYSRSYAFRQATTQGSTFKLVTAYEALVQHYVKQKQQGLSTRSLNPLEIIDRPVKLPSGHWQVASMLDGTPYPPIYKGGRLIKSLTRNIGRTDLQVALEMSSNPYFSLLAGDVIEHPEDLNRAARQFSFGARTGIDLPGEYQGRLPDDLLSNQSGLYAYAIGQHTLVNTPLQTAVMISALTNGGSVFVPKILQGESEVAREIFMPKEVCNPLMEGMGRVVSRLQSVGHAHLMQVYRNHPTAMAALDGLRGQLIGKSSTTESLERIGVAFTPPSKYNHIWFSGSSFVPPYLGDQASGVVLHDQFGNQELVVIVYLRFGGLGNESAPVAAQIVKKWREIQAKGLCKNNLPHSSA